jgi:hypothetical protein
MPGDHLTQERIRASCPAVYASSGTRYGTAFCVAAGWFLTAKHVVDKCHSATVLLKFDETHQHQASYRADGSYPEQDIALLHAPTAACAPLPVAHVRPANCSAWGYRVGWDFFPCDGRLKEGGIPIHETSHAPLEHAVCAFHPNVGESVGGVSGGPVIDTHRQAVVGILYGEESRASTVYCNPIAYAALHWPDLRPALRRGTLERPHLARPGDDFVGRQWMLEEVRAWLNEGGTPVAWITGPAGVGKTAFSNHLCDVCDEVSAAWFFPPGGSASLESVKCVCSLAWQLGLLPQWRELIPPWHPRLDPESDQGGVVALIEEVLRRPMERLRPAPSPEGPALIVVDGLDEIRDNQQLSLLVRGLAEAFREAPDWLKLVAVSRPNVTVERHLAGARRLTLEAERCDNVNDIRTWVEHRIAGMAGASTGAAVEKIVSKSDGTFLAAVRHVDAVVQGRLSLTELDKLPDGLAASYAEEFGRLATTERAQKALRSSLEVVAASYDWLTKAALGSALDDKDAPEVFCQCMGGHYTFPPVTPDIRPLQTTLTDWLTSGTATVGDFPVRVGEGHRRLAKWGLKQYADGEGTRDMAPYNALYLPLHCASYAEALDAQEEGPEKRAYWDDFEKLLKDAGFLSARQGHGSPYLRWYRFEQETWQQAISEWLVYLSAHAEEAAKARFEAATMYFNNFYWWGEYIRCDFCDVLLGLWEKHLTSKDDQAALSLVRQFDECYPKKSEYRLRAADPEAWQKTKEALLGLRHCLGCEANIAESQNREGRVHLSGLTHIYLAEAHFALNEPEARQCLDAALVEVQEEKTGDDWMTSWVLVPVAEIEARAGDVKAAIKACHDALEAVDDTDFEVMANACRVLGDIHWQQADLDRAWLAYRLSTCAAYYYQTEPETADQYTSKFYEEIAGRFVDRLLERAAVDLEAAEKECRSARAFWSQYWEAHASGESAGGDWRAWLSASDQAALTASLLPPAPTPGSKEYADEARAVVAKMEDQVREGAAALGIQLRFEPKGEED